MTAGWRERTFSALEATSARSATLGADTSAGVKSMVRLGSSAAGQKLRIRTAATAMPAGQTRKVHVFGYYSGGTSMR
jgi:hypothetical protein